MKNKTFIKWTNSNFPNPQQFSQQLDIKEEEVLIFLKNLKPKLNKIPKVKNEDRIKNNNIDITFHTDFINLSD